MSDAIETASGRFRLLEGLLNRDQLAVETGWGERTILRCEHDGMPVIVVRGTKLYPASRVREWILSHERNHEEPRGRGRPRKAARDSKPPAPARPRGRPRKQAVPEAAPQPAAGN